MMEGSVASRLLDQGQLVEDEALYSLTSRFQRDFNSKFEDLLGYAYRAEQRELDDRKRASLQNISNTNVRNVSSTRNVSQQRVINQYGASPIAAPPHAANDEVVNQLKETNKGLMGFMKQNQNGQSTGSMTSSMLRAQIIQGALQGAKQFMFGGPTATEQIVHAVKNVERAIRDQESVEMDMRTRFQKGYDRFKGGEGLGSIFKDLIEDVSNSVGNTFGGSEIGTNARNAMGNFADKSGVSSFVDRMGEKFRNMDMSSMFEGFGDSTGSPKTKRAKKKAKAKVKDDSENFFSRIVDTMTGTFDKAAKSKWTKRKSALISGALLFGDFQQSMLTTGLLHPLKALRMGIAGLGMGLQTVKNVPVLLSLGTAFQQFGLQGGALATIPIMLIRAYGAMENFADGVQDMGKGFLTAMGGWVRSAGRMTLMFIGEVIDTGARMKDVILDWGSRAYEAMRRVKSGMTEKFSEIFSNIGEAMRNLGSGAKEMGSKLWTLLEALPIVGAALAAFPAIASAALAAGMAALPFILGGLAVAAIAGIGYWVYQNWDTVEEKFNTYIVDPIMNMWNSITTKFSEWGQSMIDLKDSLVEKVTGIKDSIANAISGIFDGIMNKIKSAAEILPDWANPFSGDEESGSTDKSQAEKVERSKDITPVSTESFKVRRHATGMSSAPQQAPSEEKVTKKLDELIRAVRENGGVMPPVQPDTGPSDIRTYMETR